MSDFDPTETTTLPQQPDPQIAGNPAPAPEITAPAPKDLKELDVFRDPNKLASAAQIFLSHGDDMGLQWLQHVHTALRENAGEAIQHLQAGNGEEAVKAFNKSGMFQNAKSATDNGDGTWNLTTSNGQTQTIDPSKEAAALMSPQAYAQLQQEKARNQAYIAAEEGRGKYYQNIGDQRVQIAEIQAEGRRLVDQANNFQKSEHDRLTKEINDGKLSQQQAAREMQDKFGPAAFYANAYDKAEQNPMPGVSSVDRARAALVFHPNVIQKLVGDEIYMIDANTKKQVGPPFKNAAEFKAITGKDFYVPKGPSEAPASQPAANKPGSVTPAAPPKLVAPGDAARLAQAAENRRKDGAAIAQGASTAASGFRSGLQQVLPSWMK